MSTKRIRSVNTEDPALVALAMEGMKKEISQEMTKGQAMGLRKRLYTWRVERMAIDGKARSDYPFEISTRAKPGEDDVWIFTIRPAGSDILGLFGDRLLPAVEEVRQQQAKAAEDFSHLAEPTAPDLTQKLLENM